MQMSKKAQDAIKLVKTGKLSEAIDVALRGNRVHQIEEAARKQKQVFFAPNQDALNQLLLRIEDKLPAATFNVADHTNGAQSGFAVSVSGDLSDHDVASLGAVKGISRLDGPAGDLK
jgi:hypothetical protein